MMVSLGAVVKSLGAVVKNCVLWTNPFHVLHSTHVCTRVTAKVVCPSFQRWKS